tara:strand:- start:47737 stop:50889 length:3153 start_codon:yes stop_codon:yes gene_type:complete
MKIEKKWSNGGNVPYSPLMPGVSTGEATYNPINLDDPNNLVQSNSDGGKYGSDTGYDLIKLAKPWNVAQHSGYYSSGRQLKDLLTQSRYFSGGGTSSNKLIELPNYRDPKYGYGYDGDLIVDAVIITKDANGNPTIQSVILRDKNDKHIEIQRPNPESDNEEEQSLRMYNFRLNEDKYFQSSGRQTKPSLYGDDYIDDEINKDLEKNISYGLVSYQKDKGGPGVKMNDMFVLLSNAVEDELIGHFYLPEEKGGVRTNFAIQNLKATNYFRSPLSAERGGGEREISVDREITTSETLRNKHWGLDYGWSTSGKDSRRLYKNEEMDLNAYTHWPYDDEYGEFAHANGTIDTFGYNTQDYIKNLIVKKGMDGGLRNAFNEKTGWDLDVLADAGIHITKTGKDTFISIETPTKGPDGDYPLNINFKLEPRGTSKVGDGFFLNANQNQQFTQALTNTLLTYTSAGSDILANTLQGTTGYRDEKDRNRAKWDNADGKLLVTWTGEMPWGSTGDAFYTTAAGFQSQGEVEAVQDYLNETLTWSYDQTGEKSAFLDLIVKHNPEDDISIPSLTEDVGPYKNRTNEEFQKYDNSVFKPRTIVVPSYLTEMRFTDLLKEEKFDPIKEMDDDSERPGTEFLFSGGHNLKEDNIRMTRITLKNLPPRDTVTLEDIEQTFKRPAKEGVMGPWTHEEIAELNPGLQPTKGEGGEREVPSTEQTGNYLIEKGDTMWGISRELGIPIDDIIKSNPDYKGFKKDKTGSLIYAGDRINIPTATELTGKDKLDQAITTSDKTKESKEFLESRETSNMPLIHSSLSQGWKSNAPEAVADLGTSVTQDTVQSLQNDKENVENQNIENVGKRDTTSVFGKAMKWMQKYQEMSNKRKQRQGTEDAEDTEEETTEESSLSGKGIPFISGKKGAMIPKFDEGGENKDWLLEQMQNPAGNLFTSGYTGGSREEKNEKKTTKNNSGKTENVSTTKNVKKDGYWKKYKKESGKSWQEVILERKARKQRHKKHLKETKEWENMTPKERKLSILEAKKDVKQVKHSYKKGSGWKNPTQKK